MRSGIAIAGTIILDKIYDISAYPSSGELTKICDIRFSVGGCVPNVGIDLKKISPDLPIIAYGRMGKDSEGDYIIDELQKNGVLTDKLVRCDKNTSFTDVMSVVGGQRTFFTYAGAGADFGTDDVELSDSGVKMLHLGYFLLLDKVDNGDGIEILKNARKLGIKTSIDLVTENSDRYSLVIPALEYTDNLIINECEAGMLAGIEPRNENLRAIAERLMELGVKERVIIHKPDVAICLSKDGYTTLPSYDLPKGYIKGTTGAGDAFCAGALKKIHDDASDLEILEFASAAAVMALSSADATSGMKTEEETKEFCSKLGRINI